MDHKRTSLEMMRPLTLSSGPWTGRGGEGAHEGTTFATFATFGLTNRGGGSLAPGVKSKVLNDSSGVAAMA